MIREPPPLQWILYGPLDSGEEGLLVPARDVVYRRGVVGAERVLLSVPVGAVLRGGGGVREEGVDAM